MKFQFKTKYGEPVKVGRNTYIGPDHSFFHPQTEVGKYCSIAWNVAIGTSFHPQDWLSTSIFQYCPSRRSDLYEIQLPEEDVLSFEWRKPVYIANDVWIGCNVTILDGVKVGNGAIIGANSVVNRDVSDYAIVGGNPARLIRYRFDDTTIERLLHIKWWDLDETLLFHLPFNKIHECLDILEDRIHDLPLPHTHDMHEWIQHEKLIKKGLPFWARLNYYMPDSASLFSEIFTRRPDILAILDTPGFNVEKLLLWAWQKGQEEEETLNSRNGDLGNSIRKIAQNKAFNIYPDIPPILYILYQTRKDLKQFDIESDIGRKALHTWLITYGIKECDLLHISDALNK